MTVDAGARWRAALESLAIPEDILAAAPESPYGFSVELFARVADEAMDAETPSVRSARAALPEGGAVLDVGCGAGAASLPLAPPAGRLIGVDESPGMLAEYARRAEALGVAVEVVAGRWSDVADAAPVADVVVCRNVVYNVADLGAFAARLTDHARARVVVELTAEHPLAWLVPYWWELHGLERPPGPTVDDAVAVLRACGLDVAIERWEATFALDLLDDDARVAFLRRRLCLPVERDSEVRAAVERHGVPERREVATLWWPGAA